MTHEGWKRIFIGLGGLNGAIAVSMGAYATHVLAGTQQDFGLKGSNYQLYHAAALLAVAALQRPGGRFAVAAGLLLSLGMLLFCGGLYGVAVCGATGARSGATQVRESSRSEGPVHRARRP